MKAVQLLENIEWNDKNAHAQPLFVAATGRILRFTLRPGQTVREHEAPHSPVYIMVLKGKGMFAGGDGIEQPFGPNSLLLFDPGETHSIRAVDEEVICAVFLHGAPGAHDNEKHKVGARYK